MSRPNQLRRAVVVLTSGRGQPTLPTIGNRSLPQYWALLKTHFRGILLAPQSLSDGASTQWTWREPIERPSLTAAELATVRKRLVGAQRSLADSVEDTAEPDAAHSRRAGSVLPQLQTHMDATVAALVAQSDAALAPYVARTDQGLLLHSWGLAPALTPHYPDDTECEIAGTVLVTNSPAPDRDVRLETSDGTELARTRSDVAGKFRFQKIPPGRYRTRAISDRETFPSEGVVLEIDRSSVTGVELRDCGDDQATVVGGRSSNSRRCVALLALFGVVVLVVAAIAWWHRGGNSAASVAAVQPVVPARSASEARGERAEPKAEQPPSVFPTRESSATGGSSATDVVIEKKSPRASATEPTPRAPKQHSAIVLERHVGGLPGQQPGSSATGGLPTASASAASGNSAGTGKISNSSGTGSSSGASANAAATATSAAPSAPSAPQGRSAASQPSAAALSTLPAPAVQNPPPPAPKPVPPTVATGETPSARPSDPKTAQSSPAATTTAGNTDPAKSNLSAPDAPEAKPTDNIRSKSASPDSAVEDRRDDPPLSTDAVLISSSVTMVVEPSPDSPINIARDDFRTDSLLPARPMQHPLRLRLRVGRWQTRLLDDAILPTGPTRVGEDDAVEALRERLFLERRVQIPLLLKEPVIQLGFQITLPLDALARLHPHWRNAAASRATISGNRVEIFWLAASPQAADDTLLTDDGRELAHATTDDHGTLTLITAAGVTGWPWIGFERPPREDAHLTATEWSARLEWRVLSGAPAAPTWRRDDRWLNNHGHRLDLVLGELRSGSTTHALALVDRVTGWAAVSEIEQSQEPSDSTLARSR